MKSKHGTGQLPRVIGDLLRRIYHLLVKHLVRVAIVEWILAELCGRSWCLNTRLPIWCRVIFYSSGCLNFFTLLNCEGPSLGILLKQEIEKDLARFEFLTAHDCLQESSIISFSFFDKLRDRLVQSCRITWWDDDMRELSDKYFPEKCEILILPSDLISKRSCLNLVGNNSLSKGSK